MKIEIETNPYGDKKRLFPRKSVELKPGLTIFVGCNGAGKSTLLKMIHRYLEKNDMDVIFYDNSHEGKYMKQKALDRGNIEFLATAMSSSEGEEIVLNLGSVARSIGVFVQKKRNSTEPLFILFDAVSSGLSIDTIIDIKRNLFDLIIEDASNKDVYILITANEFEFANGENCLDVQHLKYVSFDNYEKYKEFVLNSKEVKNKRFD